MTDTDPIQELGVVASLLSANEQRRERTQMEMEAAKDELRALLFRGQKARMDVAGMAAHAGISRDTAHSILKEGGIMSWKQKQAWAAKVMEAIPRGGFEQNKFRMFVQTDLYRALSSNPGNLTRSIEGVLNAATETMHTIGGNPSFVPNVVKTKLAGLTWPTEPFELFQKGKGPKAEFQLRQAGVALAPWRKSGDALAHDLKAASGDHPAFIDRTGPECLTTDGRRIGWDVLRDLS